MQRLCLSTKQAYPRMLIPDTSNMSYVSWLDVRLGMVVFGQVGKVESTLGVALASAKPCTGLVELIKTAINVGT